MSTHFPHLPSITDLYTKLTFELRVKGYFEIHYRPFICTYFNLKILVSHFFFLIIMFYPNYKYNQYAKHVRIADLFLGISSLLISISDDVSYILSQNNH